MLSRFNQSRRKAVEKLLKNRSNNLGLKMMNKQDNFNNKMNQSHQLRKQLLKKRKQLQNKSQLPQNRSKFQYKILHLTSCLQKD